jgi:ABC-type polysaccharide/polyol phosphate export permease
MPLPSWRHQIELVRQLTRREFLLSYRASALGLGWSLLLPVAQLVILVVVFERVVPLRLEAYPAFVFSALLPWTWFSASLTAASGVFVNNRDLLRRPGFTPALLVVVTMLANLILFLVALPILFAILVWYRRAWTAHVLLFPLLAAVEGTLIVGLGLMVASLNVLYRDVQYVVGVALTLVFYLTGVFYEPGAAPAGYEIVFLLNPMAGLVGAYRAIFFAGAAPDWQRLGLAAAASAVLAATGWATYRRHRDELVDLL